jgi:hypothetical protein
MHKSLPLFLYVSISLVLAFQATAKEFQPTSSETRDAFYNQRGRTIQIKVEPQNAKHAINERFLGINLSYFNTTDEIWNNYDFNNKLKNAGVGAMRYPGGEETSYFHWRNPGVNGYEDIWDDASSHGSSPGRGKFQSTWVAPENWDSNESFMDFDEFMTACKAVGAEPIVGINMSSGLKHKRQEEGVKEALEWMRYAKKAGYEITYWFLDNETWNREANHTFTDAEYIEECLRYGRAIKAEFPNVKLIANPVGCSNLSKEGIQSFVSATGHVRALAESDPADHRRQVAKASEQPNLCGGHRTDQGSLHRGRISRNRRHGPGMEHRSKLRKLDLQSGADCGHPSRIADRISDSRTMKSR